MQLDYSNGGKLPEMWEWVRLRVEGGDGNHYTSSPGQVSLLQTTTKSISAYPSRPGQKEQRQ